ncbi:MAG: acyl-CoA dehydrogenase family protein, partial [Candidatus Aminicenantes bacterium]
MDFLLTDEQKMLKESIQKFAQKEIGPLVKESDQKGLWTETFTRKLGDMGLLGIVIPPEHSGAGYSNLDYVLILEELYGSLAGAFRVRSAGVSVYGVPRAAELDGMI